MNVGYSVEKTKLLIDKHKTCSICKVHKKITKFYAHPNGVHGVDNRCITCLKSLNRSTCPPKSTYGKRMEMFLYRELELLLSGELPRDVLRNKFKEHFNASKDVFNKKLRDAMKIYYEEKSNQFVNEKNVVSVIPDLFKHDGSMPRNWRLLLHKNDLTISDLKDNPKLIKKYKND